MAQIGVARDHIQERAAPGIAGAVSRMRAWALGVLGLCVISMSLGSTWDVKWHYAIGRDSFWIPPHIVLYASVALAGLVCAAVVLYETWRSQVLEASIADDGAVRLLGLSAPLGVLIGGCGVALILLAAPFDDWWHRLYGVDVTIWSPPHMTGVIGGGLVAFGGLVAAAEQRRRQNGHWADAATLLFLMALVSNANFALIPAVKLSFWPHAPSPAQDPLAPHPLIYPVLASLLVTHPLVAAVRLFKGRWSWLAPLLVLAALVGLHGLQTVTGRAGFALFVPWGDQTIVRPPIRAERALWDHPTLLALPTLAIVLVMGAGRRWRFWHAALLAGAICGLVLTLETPPIFLARNPGDTIDPYTVAFGLALALPLGALSGLLGAAIGGWLGGSPQSRSGARKERINSA